MKSGVASVTKGGCMIRLLLNKIFGCPHNRTTFPLTRSHKSKLTEAIQRRTYVVCLACGQEFDYNWREMRIGAPVGELSIPPSALQAEQSVAH